MKIILFICMLLISNFANACIDGNTPEKLEKRQHADFNHHDQNGNGKVTLGEFMLTETKNKQSKNVNFNPFINSDKDKSGDISFDEWNNFRDKKYYMLLLKGGC